MATTKREAPREDELKVLKKVKFNDVSNSLELKSKPRVVLNPADCDLGFNIEGNGLKGSGLYEKGFAYRWSGARANIGITGGNYCFSCKIISEQPVEMEDTAPDLQHLCRLGISRGDDIVGNLGETHHSFGFGGTGKFSSGGKFSDYGEKFGIGDTIVCCINLEEKPFAFIGFSKNGKWLGTAKQFDTRGLGLVNSPMRKSPWESALFPHVLLKNVVVELQFSVEDGLLPEEGFKPWASSLEDGNAITGPMFPDIKDCEVIMMVGLPASGKTTWAEKWVREHPEKRYVLLGTNQVLDQMKVPGLLRKNNYGERFDRLMDQATGIFNTLLTRAANRPHNYVIDQTNVFKSARKRKLKPFAFFRKIAVVVFPSAEDLKFRSIKRSQEMGKDVPPDAVKNMLANFVLPISKDFPGSDEYFDQVIFAELDRVESEKCLDEMKRGLEPASNGNSNNTLSHEESSDWSYSACSSSPWESSIWPYGPYPILPSQCQGTSSVNNGDSISSYLPLLPSEFNKYQMPNQGTELGNTSSLSEAYKGNQCFPSTSAATTHSSYGGFFDRHHGGYPGTYHANPRGVTYLYQSYGIGEPYHMSSTNVNNSVLGASTDPYRSSINESFPVGNVRTSITYNAPSANYSCVGYFRGDQQAQRAPAFFPSHSSPPTNGRLFSYHLPYVPMCARSVLSVVGREADIDNTVVVAASCPYNL